MVIRKVILEDINCKNEAGTGRSLWSDRVYLGKYGVATLVPLVRSHVGRRCDK